MEFNIKDGATGAVASVDDTGRLLTRSINTSLQHYVSHHEGESYQVSTETPIVATNEPVLYLQNNDSSHDMVISYIRFQSIGATAAAETAYFTIVVGDLRTSGGVAVAPKNLSLGSANTADAVAFGGGSVLAVAGGTEIDRNYEANSMQTYNKDGSIIIPKGQSISIWCKGTDTNGTAYARISFYMDHSIGGG